MAIGYSALWHHRVGREPCGSLPPSEPYVIVSHHTAQASRKPPLWGSPQEMPLLASRYWQTVSVAEAWRCTSPRGAVICSLKDRKSNGLSRSISPTTGSIKGAISLSFFPCQDPGDCLPFDGRAEVLFQASFIFSWLLVDSRLVARLGDSALRSVR
jgi:hypothetical protein